MTSPTLEAFKDIFPRLSDQIVSWGTGGKNIIRLTFEDHRMMVFTYDGCDNWRLETLKFYTESLAD